MVVLSRSAAKRQGSVVCAEKTYASLEEIANQQDVKGVYFERGPHPRVADMENWLEQRADGVICSQTILVATPVSGPLDECGCGDDACYEDSRSRQGALPKLGGGAEIRAACVRLVKDLPATFRESVSHDAQALADMCVRLCSAAPWLTLTLEVQHFNACTKWHQDSVVSRGTQAMRDLARAPPTTSQYAGRKSKGQTKLAFRTQKSSKSPQTLCYL